VAGKTEDLEEAEEKAVNRRAGILGFFLIVVSILILIRLELLHRLEDRGREYYEITEEIKRVRARNLLLHNEILRASALSVIATKAAEQGFAEAPVLFLKQKPPKEK
jgi:hypothetical protein